MISLFLILMVTALVAAPTLYPAFANHSDPKPITTRSLYMDTVDEGTFYNQGCGDANNVDAGTDPKSGLTIMSFGAPRQFDASTYGATCYGLPGGCSTRQIRLAAEEYGRGFFNCLNSTNRNDSSVFRRLALGTHNQFLSGWSDSTANRHGEEWSRMVIAGNNWLTTSGYSGKILFRGANDIEMAFSGPSRVRAWVNGYDNPASWYLYYNFGDAAGCQTFTSGTAQSCGSATFPEWSSADVYDVSWGLQPALPFPEIYRNDAIQAEQWVMISQWGVDNGRSKLGFHGPLSQNGACGQVGCDPITDNTASQAWSQMVAKMDARPSTIFDMLYSSDIRWLNP